MKTWREYAEAAALVSLALGSLLLVSGFLIDFVWFDLHAIWPKRMLAGGLALAALSVPTAVIADLWPTKGPTP